jgi:beta-phosphoglucomutase-like phosphatase (HAD superfamily)
MFHAAEAMQVKAENCILVDDSSAGAQSGLPPAWRCFISAPIRITSRSIIPK